MGAHLTEALGDEVGSAAMRRIWDGDGWAREYAAPLPQFFVPPTSGIAGNGLPIYDWDQAALQFTRTGESWNVALGQPVTVTYAFRATGVPDPGLGVSGFQVFNAIQIAVAEEALRLWSEVANISFERVGSGTSGPGAYSDDASILFGNFVNGGAAFSAFTYLPAPDATASGDAEGDVWVNISRNYDADPASFPQGARILAHEIGHALGLLHPSDYDGGAQSGVTYADDADLWQDTAMFSNMSYFSETFTGATYGTMAFAPQMFDIAAAQRLYGANMTTRTGDTVYGFNGNTGHAVFTIGAANQACVFCIWDAGGNDTLDLSGYATGSQIDLREESFSSAGPGNGGAALYNISIARGAVIEDAIGGSGNDTIIGNNAANAISGNGGADVITGNGGNDTLIGGAGLDRLDGGAGNDVIFWDAGDDLANVLGGADTDILVFTSGSAPTSFSLTSHGFETAEARFTDTGGNPWATQTIYYDSLWRADIQVTVNDDGSHGDLDYDQLNAFNWSTNFNAYDALARVDITVTVFDDGTNSAFDFDQANAFNWVSNWNLYTASNAVDLNETIFDSGVSTSNDFDPNNLFSWTSNWIQKDAGGLLDLNETIFDSGITSSYDFDQADAFDWSSNWNQYNAAHQLDINVTVFDDGTSTSNDFDENSVFDWTSNWNRYDAANHVDLNITVYDNGNTAVVDYDLNNEFSWSSEWSLYDSQGHLIGHVLTPDGP